MVPCFTLTLPIRPYSGAPSASLMHMYAKLTAGNLDYWLIIIPLSMYLHVTTNATESCQVLAMSQCVWAKVGTCFA